MKRKKILLKNINNRLKLKCPKCNEVNIFSKNHEYKFIYCKKCKYVYAWIENKKYLVYEYTPETEHHIKK